MSYNKFLTGDRVSKSRAGRETRSGLSQKNLERFLYCASMLLSHEIDPEDETEEPEEPPQDNYVGLCPYTGCYVFMDGSMPVQDHFSKHVECDEPCPECTDVFATVQEFLHHTETCLRHSFDEAKLDLKEHKRRELSQQVLAEFRRIVQSRVSVLNDTSNTPNRQAENTQVKNPGSTAEPSHNPSTIDNPSPFTGQRGDRQLETSGNLPQTTAPEDSGPTTTPLSMQLSPDVHALISSGAAKVLVSRLMQSYLRNFTRGNKDGEGAT